jgi:hypothetical protein
LIKTYLEINNKFKFPLTQKGSDYLDKLGIENHVIKWKEIFDRVQIELGKEDQEN